MVELDLTALINHISQILFLQIFVKNLYLICRKFMERTQIILTVILLVIELVAFAWLIIDIRKSKKKQDVILDLEKQILKMEETIMETENNIIDEIKGMRKDIKNLQND